MEGPHLLLVRLAGRVVELDDRGWVVELWAALTQRSVHEAPDVAIGALPPEPGVVRSLPASLVATSESVHTRTRPMACRNVWTIAHNSVRSLV
eukprot:6758371-Pyramimonas_sp.AAC.1